MTEEELTRERERDRRRYAEKVAALTPSIRKGGGLKMIEKLRQI